MSRSLRLLPVALLSLPLLGCPSDGADRVRETTAAASAETEPPEGEPVQVRFEARMHGQAWTCEQNVEHGEEVFALHDLRFFVSNVRLSGAGGEEVRAGIVPGGDYQLADVAMIDLAGSGGSCDGTAGTHDTLSLVAPAGVYERLRFTLGVPFELNHRNPAEAASPLNQMAMHWGWRAGYRFLKFDGSRGDGDLTSHFGSTGCEGPMDDIQSCARPCRAEVDVALGDGPVIVELSSLLPRSGGMNCMAAPGDEDCAPTLAALSLAGDSCATEGPAGLFR